MVFWLWMVVLGFFYGDFYVIEDGFVFGEEIVVNGVFVIDVVV